MTRLICVIALLVAGQSLASYDMAHADVPTCDGQPATIVGDGNTFSLVGTPGPDVIVTNGADDVYAMGGDDLICVTGRLLDDATFRTGPSIHAGSGSDVVDATASVDRTTGADLDGDPKETAPPDESGDLDVFVGGDEEDGVTTRDGSAQVDTGAGDDYVTVRGDQPSVRVDLGLGDDTAEVRSAGTLTGSAFVDGGGGQDDLRLYHDNTSAPPSRWKVDDRRHIASLGGAPVARWMNIAGFDLDVTNTHTSFLGGPAGETVTATWDQTSHAPATLSASMEGGDDQLVERNQLPALDADLGPGDDTATFDFEPRSGPPGQVDVQGGSGEDTVATQGPAQNAGPPSNHAIQFLRLDLEHATMTEFSHQRPQRVAGFEDASVIAAGPIRLTGTPGPNVLTAETGNCHSTLLGGHGADTMTQISGGDCPRPKHQQWRLFGGTGDDHLDGRAGDDQLFGGPGNDHLIGNQGDDILVGGPGDDYAGGGPGTDTCTAERETRCED